MTAVHEVLFWTSLALLGGILAHFCMVERP
jgi:hypothetical protein